MHGKPRRNKSQGSVKCINRDQENIQTTWIQVQNTSQWSQGLHYIYAKKNIDYQLGTYKDYYLPTCHYLNAKIKSN